jgi:hypothetical protein
LALARELSALRVSPWAQNGRSALRAVISGTSPGVARLPNESDENKLGN